MGGEGRPRLASKNLFDLLESDKHFVGLHRLRDSLFAELRDLNKSKPRGKADENLIAEINRLESTLLITRDDLVRSDL